MSLRNQEVKKNMAGTPPLQKGISVLAQKKKLSIKDLPELPLEDSRLTDTSRSSLTEDGLSFSQLLEETQKGTQFKQGEVVEGTIVRLDKDYAVIDIGYKSEGQVNITEFQDNKGNMIIEPGDPVLVYIEQIENEEGHLILSKEKADILRAWDEISEACEKDELVEGVVVAKVKGGLSVDIGVKAFLPGSQVDIRPTKNLDQFLGKTFKFKIIKFNKKRGNIVLSRKLLLQEERARMKEQTLSKIEEGAVTEGAIKNLTEYGAFIDLGGIDGLLHITDMSWGRLKHPSEVFKVGDKIQVKILKYDEEKERVSLGYKQLFADPWNSVAEKYSPGNRVKGKVISLTDYGAFVEVEPGIEGLVHVSEMSWTQRVKHPSKLVNEGDLIEAVVLDIDHGNRRISLGMKQIEPNPWDTLLEKYPIGTRISGQIKNITDFGIFIGVPEGLDGLIHVSDIAWDNKTPDPNAIFKKGDEVECVVLSIDKTAEKFSLGIKQLTEDPWKAVADRYPNNAKIKGKITKITDFGVFVEVEPGVEGLIHVSELEGDLKGKEKLKSLKEGQELECMVTSVDMKEHKLALSQRALHKAEERENIKHYTKQNLSSSKTSLGDLLNESLAQKLKEVAGSTEKKDTNNE